MKRSKYAYAPLALAITSLLLAGCSSSSDDDDVIESSLSDDQQVFVATQGLAGFSNETSSFADQADGMDSGGDSSSTQSNTVTTASPDRTDCNAGGYTEVTDPESFEGSNIPFPDQMDSTLSGSQSGLRFLANDCTWEFNGQSTNMDGQVELIDIGDMEAGDGTIYVRFGGVSSSDFADINSPFKMGDEMLSQGHMTFCYNCVDKDPGDNSGETQDSAFVGHFISETSEFRMELGENVPDGQPLTVFTTPEGGGGALVDANGRHAFEDGDCAIDVTMETVTKLQVNNWGPAVSDPGIQSGEMNVTANQSGQTMKVEWINGELFIDDEPVDQDLRSEMEECL